MGKGSGVNLPCPCGSGEKFKKCCLLNKGKCKSNVPTHIKILQKQIDAVLGKDFDLVSMSKALSLTAFRLGWKAFINPAEKITFYDYARTFFQIRVNNILVSLAGKIEVSNNEVEALLRQDFCISDDLNDCMDFSSTRNFEKFEEWVEKFWLHNLFKRRIPFSYESELACNTMSQTWDDYFPKIQALTPNLIHSVKDIYNEYLYWIKRNPDVIDKIAWEAFEKIVAEILISYGFKIDLTGRVRNKSADIIALRTDELGIETKYLIVCKKYSKERKVGLDIVNAVLGAKQRANVDHAILITTSSFTNDVVLQSQKCEDLRLHLKDGHQFYEWLQGIREESSYGIQTLRGWDSI